MKGKMILPRTLAVFLSLALALPQSAFALRQAGLEESAAKKDFVKALGSSTPAAGRKEDALTTEAGMEEFNPGHGDRMLKRLFTERRRLLDILRKRNTTLTLRFVNLLHTPPIRPDDIPDFSRAYGLSFELPSAAVKAFVAGEPTVIRDNPFWIGLLEAGRDIHAQQADEALIGVDTFAPARNAMRRTTYTYTPMDFDGGKPRKKIKLDGPVDLAEVGLGTGQVSEESLLSRLSPEQREELGRNRILFLHPGSPTPFSEEPAQLREEVILYRPPHESIRALMQQLRERYAEELSQRGLPASSVSDFLMEHFLFPIFSLLRDHMQMTMIFRRWQVRLKGETTTQSGKGVLVLHLGGAMHFQTLISLASRDLPKDAPVRLESLDDPRVPVLAGSFKGIPFFAERFESLMDHLRVTDEGEVKLDVRYFTDLFGEYLAKEPRTVLVQGVYHSLFPTAPDTPETGLGEVPFETYRDLVFLHGLLSQLTQEDLERLADRAHAGPVEAGMPVWEELRLTLGKEEYQSLPGIAQAGEIVSRQNADAWNNLGIARRAQGDLPGAIEAYERGIQLNPEDAPTWNNLGIARQARGDLPGAIEAYERAIELNPEYAGAWYNLGIARQARGDLPGAIEAYERAIELNPEYTAAWNNLGTTRYAQGDLPGAIAAYERAIELNPEYTTAWSNLGITRYAQGDLPGAIEAFERARKMKDGSRKGVAEDKSTAGMEENWVQDFLDILEEAVPQGPGVLVIEAGAISRRMGLAEFVARAPRRLGDRVILFGPESAEVKEIAARNGIAVVDSDRLSDLAFQLMLLGDEADRVGFLGNPVAAAALSEMLPASMELTPLDPNTTLVKLLLSLGYPQGVLDAINAAGVEELFARARAA